MTDPPDWLVRVIHDSDTDRVNVLGLATENVSCDHGGMADKKLVHEILGSITDQGFVIRKRSNGHFAIYSPDGTYVTDLASSPSEHRGHENARARLRRHGWNDPKKPHKKRQRHH